MLRAEYIFAKKTRHSLERLTTIETERKIISEISGSRGDEYEGAFWDVALSIFVEICRL
jgi:hypothetical protein